MKTKRKVNWWKVAGLILIVINVILLVNSFITFDVVKTHIGNIKESSFEQINDLLDEYEYVFVQNIKTEDKMLLKGENSNGS